MHKWYVCFFIHPVYAHNSSDESAEHQLLCGVRSAFGGRVGAVTTELLGAPDAVLQGCDWQVPVHRYVNGSQ